MTECLGGSMELAEEELGLRYQVGRRAVRSGWRRADEAWLSAVILRPEVELRAVVGFVDFMLL